MSALNGLFGKTDTNVSRFEQSAFQQTGQSLLNLNDFLATLDDHLICTRASDNQVNSLNHRKKDSKGHSIDAVTDALGRVVLALRMKRRRGRQSKAVHALILELFRVLGQKSRI